VTPADSLQTRGHDVAVARLRSLFAGSPPHALLLTGPAGVGVGTLARDAVALLFCAAPLHAAPCGACRPCRLIASGNHADLALLGVDAPAGIDEIRALSAHLVLAPIEGGRRVVLIEQASRLTEPAQHALLKLLEEPPAQTHLILVATDDRALLPTIRSRCAQLRLGLPEHEATVKLLVERLGVDAEVATRLLTLTMGRPGPLLRARAGEGTAVVHATLRASLLELAAVAPHRRLALLPGLVIVAATLLAVTDGVTAEPMPTPADRRRAAAALLRTWRALTSDLAHLAAGASVPGALRGESLEVLAARSPRERWVAFLAAIGATSSALAVNGNPELLLDALALRTPYVPPLS